MAMRWTLVEMPLGGVDQYTDAPHVVPGKLREAENVRFRDPPKCGKRYGFASRSAALTRPGSITTGKRLIAHGKESLLVDGVNVFRYAPGIDRWDNAGKTSDAHVDIERLRRDMSASVYITQGQCAINAGVLVAFWSGSNSTLTCSMIDAASGSVLYEDNIVGVTTWSNLRVFALGGYVYAVWQQALSYAYYTRVDVGAVLPSVPPAAAVTMTAQPHSTVVLDAAPVEGEDAFVISYAKLNSRELHVDKIDLSNAIVANYVGSQVCVDNTSTAVTCTSGEGAYAIFNDAAGPSVRARVLTSGLVDVGSNSLHPGTRDAPKVTVARYSATAALVCWEVAEASPDRAYMEWRVVDYLAVPAGTGTEIARLTIHSKPWSYNGRNYIVAAQDGRRYLPKADPLVYVKPAHSSAAGIYADQSTEPTYFLLELTTGSATLMDAVQSARWVGNWLRGVAYPSAVTAGVAAAAKGEWVVCVGERTRVRFGGGDDTTVIKGFRWGLDLARINLDNDVRFASASWGGVRLLAGARLSAYDGDDVHEVGFSRRPENWLVPTYAAVGGWLQSATTYTCVFVYEWEDARGNICRSAPSDVLQFLTPPGGATRYARFVLKEEPISQHKGVRVVPYRTVAGGAGPFYRDSTNGFPASYGVTIEVGRQFADAAVAGGYNDQLEKNEVLYTTGDILDNAGPPPCKVVVHHGDRIWLGGTDDAVWLWFSQPLAENDEPRFNEGLRLYIGEPVTAMASMDDQLVVWSAARTYLVSGQGPPATGGLDVGFTVSQISSDTGCANWRSVVLTPMGLMFQGRQGLYLLGRSLQMEWLGAEVRDTLDQYPQIAAATLSPYSTEVMFVANSSVASRVLVYNYALKAWTVDTPPDADILHTSAAATLSGTSDAFRYALLQANGAVWDERDGEHRDDAAPVPWHITTAWLKLNTLQGWQRIRKVLLLLHRVTGKAPFGVQVKVAYDYNSLSWSHTYSFAAAQITALEDDQIEIALRRQQCEAVRLRISEVGQESMELYDSAGPQIRSIVFEAGLKPRAAQLDAAYARK